MAIETDFGAETTTDSDYPNMRNFYKVELWTKDDQRVEWLLHAAAIASTRRAPCGCEAPPARALHNPPALPGG